MKITVKKTINDEYLDDILTTALEGGIGYWACLRNDDEAWKKSCEELEKLRSKGKIEDIFVCTVIRHMFKKGRTVRFEDAEDPDNGEIWELTKEKFIKGCELYEVKRGPITITIDNGGFDAIEADCLIQYAIFGEVIYG